jgi:hypothetical protein
VNNNEVADVLEKAADILESETVGWCQDNYYILDNSRVLSVCALGAVRAAIAIDMGLSIEAIVSNWDQGLVEQVVDGETYVSDAVRLHMDRVPVPEGYELAHEQDGWEGIHEFNDIPGQTREEVVELMKTIAKDLRNESNE